MFIFAGDLAVLMGAGWPVRRLVIFSAVSALLGFVGLLTGSVLGHQSAHISPWILALTAGVFLYVALADMVSHYGGRSSTPFSHYRANMNCTVLVQIFPFQHGSSNYSGCVTRPAQLSLV